jgi:hypothetical protein
MRAPNLVDSVQFPSSQFIPPITLPSAPQFHSFLAELETFESTGSRSELAQVPSSTLTTLGSDTRQMSIHQKLDTIFALLQQQRSGSSNTDSTNDLEYFSTIFPLDSENSVQQLERQDSSW